MAVHFNKERMLFQTDSFGGRRFLPYPREFEPLLDGVGIASGDSYIPGDPKENRYGPNGIDGIDTVLGGDPLQDTGRSGRCKHSCKVPDHICRHPGDLLHSFRSVFINRLRKFFKTNGPLLNKFFMIEILF